MLPVLICLVGGDISLALLSSLSNSLALPISLLHLNLLCLSSNVSLLSDSFVSSSLASRMLLYSRLRILCFEVKQIAIINFD